MTSSSTEAKVECDPLLLPFWIASEDSERAVLDQLMTGHLWPLVERICRRTLDRASTEDVEDASMRSLSNLLPALVNAKRKGEPIANVLAYAGRSAQHACDESLRKRYPIRARLSGQVRYVLKVNSQFSTWSAGGETVGGRTEWTGRKSELKEGGETQLASKLSASARDGSIEALVGAIFSSIGGPVPLSALISAIQSIRGEYDLARADEETSPLTEVGSSVRTDERVEQREELAWLWEEVADLPIRQAQALLLNLRDARQKGVLDLLILENVVTMPDLATVLGMEEKDLAEIWEELPWEDSRIAEFLGARPIDVSNLRSVAHRKLQRRMAKRCA